MDRRTFLAVDEDGKYFIGIDGNIEDIHTDSQLAELFVSENKVFGTCEVVQV